MGKSHIFCQALLWHYQEMSKNAALTGAVACRGPYTVLLADLFAANLQRVILINFSALPNSCLSEHPACAHAASVAAVMPTVSLFQQ